jgi:hypothetical protein
MLAVGEDMTPLEVAVVVVLEQGMLVTFQAPPELQILAAVEAVAALADQAPAGQADQA